jgi:hypothetical protein
MPDSPTTDTNRQSAALPVAAASPAALPGQGEEVDLWWGSYSGWTMLPSFAVCTLLSGIIVVAVWQVLPREYVRTTILSLWLVVWSVQLVRWGRRIFGWNYRLTTRRLFQDRGIRVTRFLQVDLTEVAQVAVRSQGLERWLGIGQLHVTFEKVSFSPMILEGVRDPSRVAELIRRAVHAARPAQEA